MAAVFFFFFFSFFARLRKLFNAQFLFSFEKPTKTHRTNLRMLTTSVHKCPTIWYILVSFGENSITKLERIGVFVQLSDNFKRSSQTFNSQPRSFSKKRNDHNISLGESGKSACTSHNNITTQKIRFPFLAFHIFPIKEYIIWFRSIYNNYTVKLLVPFVLRHSKGGFLSWSCNKYITGAPRIWYKPDNIIVVAKEESLGVFLGVVNDTNSRHKVYNILRACIEKVISALVSTIAIDPF